MASASPPLEIVADYQCRTGENPLWHAAERRLYWTDIPAGRLFRYDPVTGEHEQVYQGRQVGGFTIQADGSLLLFMDRGTVAVWRDGEIERTIVAEVATELDSRFNDVIADPAGRVFCGTMSVKDSAGKILRHGRLYRLDTDGTLTCLVEGVGTSNGMGFTLDTQSLYHTDSDVTVRTIWKYRYERSSGAISDRQLFVQVPNVPGEGRPDGLTVDAEGYIWSARWDGAAVVRYSPDGQEVQKITFPTRKTSCPAFAGDSLAELYVTTAGGDKREENGLTAGALYRTRVGVRGCPEFLSRVGLQ
ncbi:MAG: SMP-30/gluconolactonase/LRE family protein [Planctomycetes bacterium]|nr:SMP-30/gluconolactonase/LRE family protein [Planctomycetota bacterium]